MAYWVGSPEALDDARSLATRRRARRRSGRRAAGETRLFVRAVALPEGPAPTFAVVLDLPDQRAGRRPPAGGDRHRAARRRPPRRNEQAQADAGTADAEAGDSGASSATAIPLPAQLGGLARVHRLADGPHGHGRRSRSACGSGEIYDRLLAVEHAERRLSFGQMLMAFIVVVGLLFLLIQFVALVMGLALARSITGSVHELFVGTERVRQGDFTHQIQVLARDQLGELADSFNSMTGGSASCWPR